MTHLADFLLARIAEDETVARAATPSPWVPGSQGWDDANGNGFIVAPYHDLDISDEDAEHITRWQPARVLADCDAKRRIVEDAQPWADEGCRYGRCTHQVGDADGGETHWRGVQGWHVLTGFALPYADHPDYREEWKP